MTNELPVPGMQLCLSCKAWIMSWTTFLLSFAASSSGLYTVLHLLPCLVAVSLTKCSLPSHLAKGMLIDIKKIVVALIHGSSWGKHGFCEKNCMRRGLQWCQRQDNILNWNRVSISISGNRESVGLEKGCSYIKYSGFAISILHRYHSFFCFCFLWEINLFFLPFFVQRVLNP